jgi:hypothetical protein
MAGSLLAANRARPGVIVWSIKGNYVPMEEFVPPPPPKPGAPPVNAAATPAAKPAGQ